MTVPRRLVLWVPPVAYMVVIYHVSAETDPLPQVTAIVWDKALHMAEYAGLGLLFCRALVGERLGWFISTALALVATSTYGASDEWHQLFVAGRESDIHDWLADTIGGSLGVALWATRALDIGHWCWWNRQ